MLRSFLLKVFDFFGVGKNFDAKIAANLKYLSYDPSTRETTFKTPPSLSNQKETQNGT
jgi:hypothetical protein